VKGAADDEHFPGLVATLQHFADASSHVGFADEVFVVGVQLAPGPESAAELEDLADVRGRLSRVLEMSLPPRLVVRVARQPCDRFPRVIQVRPRVFAGGPRVPVLCFFLDRLAKLVEFEEDRRRQVDEADFGLVSDAPGECNPLRLVGGKRVKDRADRGLLRVGQHGDGRPRVLVDEVFQEVGRIGRTFHEDGRRPQRVQHVAEVTRRRRREMADAENPSQRRPCWLGRKNKVEVGRIHAVVGGLR
jgi:hypothetical protein